MAKRPQSANRLTEAVRHAVRTAVRAAETRNLLVACSGGPDSVCLLDVVAHVARQEGWTVTVGHAQHGVRADDDADLALVRAHAERLSLPARSMALVWTDTDGGPARSEGVLRVRRYQSLVAMGNAVGAEAILTGHTMDDQAETVLLHLLRGAGLDGLSGMRAIAAVPVEFEPARGARHDAPPTVRRLVRPLLSVRKAETVAYCVAHGLPFIEDPSNADSRYTRNWMRHDVLPLMGSRFGNVTATLARSAAVVADDAQYLAEQTGAALARALRTASGDLLTLDATAFHAEHPALRRRMVRSVLQRQTGHAPRASDVDELLRAMTRAGSSMARVGTIACCVVGATLLVGAPGAVEGAVHALARCRHPLFRGAARIVPDARFEFPPNGDEPTRDTLVVQRIGPSDWGGQTGEILLDALLRLPERGALALRNRLPGDLFMPAGRPHALRLQDYLTEQRVPALIRDRLPLLVVDGTIAWVIGYDVSAACAAMPETASHRAVVTRHDC